MVSTPGTPATVDDRPLRTSWPVVFLLFTGAGLLRFTYLYLDDVTRYVPGTAVPRLIEEATGAYAALLLFPAIAFVEQSFPLTLGRWRRHWMAHVTTFVAYSAVHTTLLAVSRILLFPLFGLGQYDYGRMPTRYFMEAPQDVISYGAFIGVLTFLRVQRLLRDRERRSAALERDAVTARLEALSLRLQPHFLFNALNTISSVVYDDPVAADTMIGRLGELLRQALRTSDRQEVPVHEELDTLRAYLTFIEARFGDRVRCTVDVDRNADDLAVPAFLLQPLVENAVRHGTSADYSDSSILISIKQVDTRLVVDVENDAIDSPLTPRVGTGLGTTRDRLHLMYGDRATFDAAVRDGRFCVHITIPATPIAARPALEGTSAYASADR
jgi:two-component system, LytTR family, sensor kinase